MSQEPRRFGNYEVVRTLGRGGMAEVVLARLAGADGFEREVVIKRILGDYAAEPHFVDMFRDEARITAALRHGNIVQVLEFREERGEYLLVLEYVDGPPLHTLLADARATGRRLSYPVIAYILSELARALDYAHRKRGADGEPLGIVHRDVSPSNTLLSRDGEVKLSDFGIARAKARITSTTGGDIKGKLSYMAPEMLHGRAEPRSDLFALGAMGWELCAGRPPFEAESFEARILRILEGVRGSLTDVVPDVPPALAELIGRLLQKDPADRPARASEVTDALAALVGSAGHPVAEDLAQLVLEVRAPLAAITNVSVPAPVTRPRALIVERSSTVRALLRSAIGGKLDVVEVEEPSQALEVVRGGPVVLVVSQYQLGAGTSGIDLCEQVRAQPDHGQVAFVLVLSDADATVEQRARAAGVTSVASKGDAAALLRCVRGAVTQLVG